VEIRFYRAYWKTRCRQNHDARGPIRGAQPQKIPPGSCQTRQSLDFGCCPFFSALSGRRPIAQLGKYDRALAAFEKMLPTAPVEIRERCKMYISTCQRQLERPNLTFATPEEHYDYAVLQIKHWLLRRGREQFNSILSGHPNADYAFYGLALLDAITGQAQECLDHLAKAIQLNPRNRLQARVDNDFQSMVDDPRFTELLYPEIP